MLEECEVKVKSDQVHSKWESMAAIGENEAKQSWARLWDEGGREFQWLWVFILTFEAKAPILWFGQIAQYSFKPCEAINLFVMFLLK